MIPDNLPSVPLLPIDPAYCHVGDPLIALVEVEGKDRKAWIKETVRFVSFTGKSLCCSSEDGRVKFFCCEDVFGTAFGAIGEQVRRNK